MRFWISEHKAIVKAIETNGMQKDEFSFRKKGGLLFVEHADQNKPFSFHWKMETVLDDSGKWSKRYSYMFDKPSKAEFETDRDGILFAFDIWLQSLKD